MSARRSPLRLLLLGSFALLVLGGAFVLLRGSEQSAKPAEVSALSPSEPAPTPEASSATDGRVVAPSPAAPAARVSPSDEASLMSELRTYKDTDAEYAIQLAREGNQRFPDSVDAPERSSILIHALASAGRASEARGEAENMVNHYPDSAWVQEVERFTGAHRHRNAHLTADGQLAFD